MTDEDLAKRCRRVKNGIDFEKEVEDAISLLSTVLEAHRRKHTNARFHYGASGCGVEYAIQRLTAATDYLNAEAEDDDRLDENGEPIEERRKE